MRPDKIVDHFPFFRRKRWVKEPWPTMASRYREPSHWWPLSPMEGNMEIDTVPRVSISLRRFVYLPLFCLVIALLPQLSHAEECSPFQISLLAPAQLVAKEKAICGARFSLIYGDNASVSGLDVGLVNVAGALQGIEIGGVNWLSADERKKSWGLQVGGINHAGNADFTGCRISLLNTGSTKASIKGLQISAYNFYLGDIDGIQIAFGNIVKDFNGVQISLLNDAESVNGLQIGGLFNEVNGDVNGVQISLLMNWCRHLKGVQIGILNVVAGRFPTGGVFVLPVINAGF
jgi:hypothetical protein